MMQRLLWVGFVGLAWITLTPGSSRAQTSVAEPERSDRQASILAIVEKAKNEQDLVGLQIAVWTKDGFSLTHELGSADLDHAVPLTRRSRMPIASVTKAMTGILFLRLEAEGVLDRSRPVREIVPEWNSEAGASITLGELVGQTHGIRHYRDEIYPVAFTTRYDKLEDALPIFVGDALVAEPGSRYTYSSYAYTLLGVAIERATRKPFTELIRDYVLEPAGMQHTVANHVTQTIEGRVATYSYYGFRWPFNETDLVRVPPLDMSYNQAGGNYLSTAEDLVLLGRAVLAGSLLDEAAMRKLTVSQTTRDDRPTGWSHGWFVRDGSGELELRINGANPGSWSHLHVYLESGIVVAMNTNTWGRGSREGRRGLGAAMDEVYEVLIDRK